MKKKTNGMELEEPANRLIVDSKRLIIHGIIENQLSMECSMFFPEMDKYEDPFAIHINSEGGDMYATIAIMSLLKQMNTEIVVDIEGVAMSGAALIAMCGDVRRISSEGLMMFHYPIYHSDDSSLHVHELENKVTKEHYERVLKLIVEKSKMSFADFKQKMKNQDFVLTPKEALKLGFVTEVY